MIISNDQQIILTYRMSFYVNDVSFIIVNEMWEKKKRAIKGWTNKFERLKVLKFMRCLTLNLILKFLNNLMPFDSIGVHLMFNDRVIHPFKKILNGCTLKIKVFGVSKILFSINKFKNPSAKSKFKFKKYK